MNKDAEQFKRDYLPLHPRLYRLAYALTENSHDAEDILQEAYYKLWKQRKELTHIHNVEAFCYMLVKNLCFDFLRASQAKRHETAIDHYLPDASGSPEAITIAHDELRQVEALIEQLPAQQRQILRLHSLEGCTADEIGEITGLSAVNIRVLLSRARKFVREHYTKQISYERQRF
jgi:RNA polymerase sigma-70 factor (ECF subfamily)